MCGDDESYQKKKKNPVIARMGRDPRWDGWYGMSGLVGSTTTIFKLTTYHSLVVANIILSFCVNFYKQPLLQGKSLK